MSKAQTAFKDFASGLTVSFVAASLGAGFGIMSGLGAYAGLVGTGIYGIVTAFLSSTRRQISALTGPMAAATATALVALGPVAEAAGLDLPQALTWLLLLSGAWVALLGLIGVGRFVELVPRVVVSGFVDGIACIIVLSELRKLLGANGAALEGDFFQNVGLALGTFGLLALHDAYGKRIPGFGKQLPGAFIALVAATAVAQGFSLNVELLSLPKMGAVSLGLALPPPIDWMTLAALAPIALQLAFMCIIDTLLTSMLLDYKTDETTGTRRELAAQGLATALNGLLGLAPGAQATDRSTLLLREGARTRMAAAWAGVFVLLFVFVLPGLLSLVPVAVLGGILLKVALNIFDWKPFQVYFGEVREGWPNLLQWFREHAEDPVMVNHHEMALILATAAAGTFWNMTGAVALGTVAYYALMGLGAPMRDLKEEVETDSFRGKAPSK